MLREFLDSNKVAYSVHSHPEVYTAQEIAALQHVKGRMLAKVVIARSADEFVMLVLPADRRVDFDKLERLGLTEARLAQEAEFANIFPGCDVGAMPPFGNLYGLPVYVDTSLQQGEEIVFNAGTHTLTAKLAFRDFASLVTPVIADFTVHG
jgi:Ala-tRNA(Pro) deacylase